ncbi:MAG: ABC-2 transporter permease [Eubacteriales bacterium]
MNNTLNSIRLDYYILKGTTKLFLAIAYVIAIVLGVFSKAPYLMVPIVMILTTVSSGQYFSVYEKNNLGRLYGVLPLNRTQTVVGRYVYTLVFGLLNWAVSIALAILIMLFINKSGSDFATFINFICFAFFYFCLFVGVSFPIFYKFPYSKAYAFTSLPFYFVFIFGMILSRNAAAAGTLQQLLKYFPDNSAMTWVLGIGVGLIILVLSCLLSVSIHKKNEL